MTAHPILQLLFAFAFIALLSFITYKLTPPLMVKMIDLCFESPFFNNLVAFSLALFFCLTGVFQLKDFVAETGPSLSRFFPLSFISSGLFLFLGFWNIKYPK